MVKCCYSIGRIDKKLAKFLILFLINEIGSIFYFKYLSDKENVNNFVDFLLRTIGEILGGLLIPCIIKYKKHYSEQIKIKQIIKENYLLWLINAFVFGSNVLLINFFIKSEYSKSVLSSSKALEMLIFFLITFFFMKYTYYRHHYVSMVIFVVSSISIDILVGYFYDLKVKVLYIYLYYLFYSLLICNIKYLMDFKYKNYWSILLSIGLCNIFLFIVYLSILLIIQHIKGKLNLIEELIFYFTKVEKKYIIIRTLFEFIFLGIYFPIIRFAFLKEFTPNHLLISGAISDIIFNYIIFLIKRRNWKELFIAVFFILQGGSLFVYLEIEEYKCCGLSKNTKKNILLREESANLYDDEDSIIDGNLEMSPGYLFKENKEDKEEIDENIKINENEIDNIKEKEENKENEVNEKNI